MTFFKFHEIVDILYYYFYCHKTTLHIIPSLFVIYNLNCTWWCHTVKLLLSRCCFSDYFLLEKLCAAVLLPLFSKLHLHHWQTPDTHTHTHTSAQCIWTHICVNELHVHIGTCQRASVWPPGVYTVPVGCSSPPSSCSAPPAAPAGCSSRLSSC